MSTELAPLPDGSSSAVTQATVPQLGPLDLYAALLADAGKETTRKARQSDARDLARFLGNAEPAEACAALVMIGRGKANAVATAYQRSMLDRGLAPSSINRRLSTLTRIVALANRFDLVDWSLTIDGLPVETYRDTAGPGRAGWLRLYDQAKKAAKGGFRSWRADFNAGQGKRDLAVICLLYFNHLRREEVVQLDLADWNPETGRLAILGKGRYERELVTLNGETVAALEGWIDARGPEPGPLFTRLDHAARGLQRIGGRAVWEIVRATSKAAGLKTPVRPHGLRHQAATELARRTNGNVLKIQKALRHKDPKTSQKYVDNLEDVAGEMSRLLSED